ncbi:hypothetical protein [Polynucleobacter necessarius]|uniref:hypothetical protein n=1 Tax=Polynucleobacter necessarius TaxID=576610 RepID=UPI000E0946BE|nr:hypothetical protein [Polynucleobacter necessarius]HAT39457.1 hypothetical protein [Polynucleobacter sp.]
MKYCDRQLEMKSLKKIYVLGAGAVVCFFVGILARAGLVMSRLSFVPIELRRLMNLGLNLIASVFKM